MSSQNDLSFGGPAGRDGLEAWRKERHDAMQGLAERLALPLNRRVEVWLRGDIRLRGNLRLREEVLFPDDEEVNALPLTVDGVVFTAAEIESCIRLD